MNIKYNVMVFCEDISSNIDYLKSILTNYNLFLYGISLVNSTGSHLHEKLIECLNTNQIATVEDNNGVYDEDDCIEINKELNTFNKLNLNVPVFDSTYLDLSLSQIIVILSNIPNFTMSFK